MKINSVTTGLYSLDEPLDLAEVDLAHYVEFHPTQYWILRSTYSLPDLSTASQNALRRLEKKCVRPMVAFEWQAGTSWLQVLYSDVRSRWKRCRVKSVIVSGSVIHDRKKNKKAAASYL